MSDTTTVSPLRQRMIGDTAGRNLNPHTQRGSAAISLDPVTAVSAPFAR